MRKLLGKLGEAITRPFLYPIPLFLLLFTTFCHAQALCTGPTSATISPTTWYAGQVNIVTVTTPNFNVDNIGAYCTSFDITTTNGIEVPITSVAGVSGTASSYTFAIEPAASVPTEAALFVLEQICDPEVGIPCTDPTGVNVINWEVTYPIQIVNCPVPQITAVSPSTWFAGKTYDNVKITGTGFVTTDKATPTCPTTTVSITGADNSQVTVSNVSVVDKTKITLTVAPPASDPTQSATITAGTALPNQTTFNTAQVLGNQINCGLATMQCSQQVISTTDGSDPMLQNVVVGQPISLSTPGVPGVSVTSRTWKVGGTRIANYTPSIGGASVTELTANDLAQGNLAFFWAFPKDEIRVTYKYCATIPGVTDQDLSCSLVANAAFKVTGGGSMSSQPYKELTIDQLIPCVNGVKPAKGTKKPFVVYGDITGSNCTATYPGSTFGMTFTPSGAPSGGTYSYVQLVNTDNMESVDANSTSSCTYTQGIDTTFPYDGFVPNTNPPQAEDSPNDELEAGFTETRTFNVTMFLMWTSNISKSIAVPIGYQTWGFSGGAHQNAKDKWVATTTGTPGPVGGFTRSDGTQTTDGYTGLQDGFPTWNGPATCN